MHFVRVAAVALLSLMAGPDFAANPIGVEYDPKEWQARMKAGTPASDFLARRLHKPVSPIRGAMSPKEG